MILPEHETIGKPKQALEWSSVRNKTYFLPDWPGSFIKSMSICSKSSGQHSHGDKNSSFASKGLKLMNNNLYQVYHLEAQLSWSQVLWPFPPSHSWVSLLCLRSFLSICPDLFGFSSPRFIPTLLCCAAPLDMLVLATLIACCQTARVKVCWADTFDLAFSSMPLSVSSRATLSLVSSFLSIALRFVITVFQLSF
jgi:hypothetical protein